MEIPISINKPSVVVHICNSNHLVVKIRRIMV
jgi:hypothetical protein